ncbi:MAG: 30S ribosomal protein S6, partial [Candidatus Uhrbacteria bacterium]|nr:30S ribosomal protein S6 [Candidatus Uhrbacteria bacterium]
MNHYEFLGILNGTYADTEVGALVSQVEETIKKHAETIHYVQNLGRRKLAYPIKHQGHGTYVLIEFDADGEAIKKLDRLFRLTNELLRHCIVRRKTVGKPMPLERREEESRPTRTYERTGTRRALGEELLGDTPTLLASEEPAPASLPEENRQEEAAQEAIAPAPVEEKTPQIEVSIPA